MGELILILGGARSGKSSFAEQLALARGQDDVLYIATGQALDDEMRARITRHRLDRPAGWQTCEAPTQPAAAIAQANAGVIVLDCVTMLVSNLLLSLGDPEQGADLPDEDQAERLVEQEIMAIINAATARQGLVIAVSNEVGLGLVPPYPLGRVYRDLLGRANRLLAAPASAVYLLVAGLPVNVKRLAALDDPFTQTAAD